MDNRSLNQLSRAFSVKDIMTGARHLKRSDDHSNAKSMFEEFDVVPHPLKGGIHGFFTRDSGNRHDIDRTNIVSDGTSLFDFTKLLQRSDFYFVLSANRIIGYAHYSDLNKPLVKIPFFALSQAVERKMWDEIQDKISDSELRTILDPTRADYLMRRKKEAETKNVDLGWIGIFTFPDILRIARHHKKINISDPQIKQLKDLRNRFAHSDQPLIREKKDVKVLVDSQIILSSIMKGIV